MLLDTHIWIRWQSGVKLPASILQAIGDSECLAISAISCWELAQLVKRKRVILPIGLNEWVNLATQNIQIIPINRQIALLSEELPDHHKDPADRFIIATSLLYKCLW